MNDMPAAGDQALPIDLHFPDRRPLTVDVEAVMRSGRRIRRRRKVFAGAVAAAAIGVVGASVTYLVPPSASQATAADRPSTAFEQSTIVRTHPPAGGRITVVGSLLNPMAGGTTYSVVAWLPEGQICWGVAVLSSSTDNSATCADRPSALSTTKPAVFAPHVVSGVSDAEGKPVVIGFTSGGVAKVFLMIDGQKYEAAVVPVRGSSSIGAYAIWVYPPYDGVTHPLQFTQLTGFDGQGHVVAGGRP